MMHVTGLTVDSAEFVSSEETMEFANAQLVIEESGMHVLVCNFEELLRHIYVWKEEAPCILPLGWRL